MAFWFGVIVGSVATCLLTAVGVVGAIGGFVRTRTFPLPGH
jgi:hypothetical protein